MKHQQIQLVSKHTFIRIMAIVAMLAVMVCGMIVAVNADTAESVTFEGSNVQLENGYWVKTYDGNASVTGTVKFNGEVVTAEFNSKDVNDATQITITYEGREIVLPAKIKPAQLTWANDAAVSVVYNPASNIYTGVAVSMPALNGVIGSDVVELADSNYTVSFNASVVGENVASTYLEVALTNSNYTVAPLKVNASVTPAVITSITWEGGNSFTYGDSLSGIKAIGHYGDGKTVEMNIVNLAGIVNAGSYTLTAKVPNGDLYVVGAGVEVAQNITIAKKVYNVVLNGREFLDNGDIVIPNANNNYQLVVEGENGVQLPAEILSQITYTYNGGKDIPTKPGTYTVKATMPALDNYAFNAATLEATMNVVRNYLVVSTPSGAIVIVGENGISNSVSAVLNAPIEFSRKAIRGLKAYEGFSLTITGAEAGAKFSVYVPVSADLIAKKYSQPMTVENLYLYNGSDKTLAKDTYTVSISEDGSYYIIEGYVPQGEIALMLAPDFDIPFWSSAIGIALIVLLALILLVVIPIAVGMKLVQVENSGRNPVIAVETVGDVPEVEPVVIPDIIEDPDAIIEEGMDTLVDKLMAEPLPEEEIADADASEAVADVMAELNEELAGIDLGNADGALNDMADQMALDLAETVDAEKNEADISDEVQKAVADAMAENFNESADATDAIALVEDEEVVEEPVVEEVVEEPVVEEPVVEEVVEEPVVEEVVAEEPVVEEPAAPASEETEEDEEEESFGGFGSMPLDYIDAIVEAERYAEMLEQESRGEVQLVTRYRRSYLSRLAQSQGSIQDYYNVIKNLLLSYKGVKSRMSWNFESFNVGRNPIAKFNAKTRTLYIYIALSPEELVDTKYNFTDMSEKKKYAAVPVLIKVKGERKYKHAIELLTKLCEEKLQLPKKKNFEEVDYRMPFKTTEELVNEGIIKKMVAAIPVSPAPVADEEVVEEAPVEEVVVEEAPVEEVVAEEVVAEEVVAEEAVAEEAVAEEAVAEEAVVEEAVAEEAPVEEAVVEEEVSEEVTEEAPVEEAVEDNDQNA